MVRASAFGTSATGRGMGTRAASVPESDRGAAGRAGRASQLLTAKAAKSLHKREGVARPCREQLPEPMCDSCHRIPVAQKLSFPRTPTLAARSDSGQCLFGERTADRLIGRGARRAGWCGVPALFWEADLRKNNFWCIGPSLTGAPRWSVHMSNILLWATIGFMFAIATLFIIPVP